MADLLDLPAPHAELDMTDESKQPPSGTGPIDEKVLNDFYAKMRSRAKEIRDGNLPEYVRITDVEGGGERLTQVSRKRR